MFGDTNKKLHKVEIFISRKNFLIDWSEASTKITIPLTHCNIFTKNESNSPSFTGQSQGRQVPTSHNHHQPSRKASPPTVKEKPSLSQTENPPREWDLGDSIKRSFLKPRTTSQEIPSPFLDWEPTNEEKESSVTQISGRTLSETENPQAKIIHRRREPTGGENPHLVKEKKSSMTSTRRAPRLYIYICYICFNSLGTPQN